MANVTPENREAFLAFVAKALDTEGVEMTMSEVRPPIPHPETGKPMPGPEVTTTISLRYITKHNALVEPLTPPEKQAPLSMVVDTYNRFLRREGLLWSALKRLGQALHRVPAERTALEPVWAVYGELINLGVITSPEEEAAFALFQEKESE